MDFSYKPVNPFRDDGLSKEDRAMIDGMRNTAYVCGYRGGDVEFAVHQALKRMGRYDLLPPCAKESDDLKLNIQVINAGNCMRCGREIEIVTKRSINKFPDIFFCPKCAKKMKIKNTKQKERK